MNFTLIGTFSSMNKGDMAMHIALTKALRNTFPQSSVSVITPFPKIDQSRYDEIFEGIHCIQSPFRNPVLAILCLVFACLTRILPVLRRWPLLWLSKRIPALNGLKVLADSDSVFDVSGDATGESYGLMNVVARVIYSFTILCLGRPFIFAAQMMGPFTYSRSLYRQILRRSKLVVTRDPMSFQRVSALDARIKVVLRQDLAFLLEPTRTPKIEKLIQAIEKRSPTGLVVGLNISRIFTGYFSVPVTLDDLVQGTACWVRKFVSSHPQSTVVFIPHVVGVGAGKDDRVLGQLVRDALDEKTREQFLTITDELTPGEIKAVIGVLGLLVSARMHACVAGLSQSIPVVNLGYSDKSLGLIRDYFQLTESVIDIRKNLDIEKMWAQVDQNISRILNPDSREKYLLSDARIIEVRKAADLGVSEAIHAGTQVGFPSQNVSWIAKNGLCHGCGVCAGVCPVHGALELMEGSDYEIKPNVHSDVCTNCGICVRACPGWSVDFRDLALRSSLTEGKFAPALGYYQSVVQCWAGNPEIRIRGSSGGVITAMLTHALQQQWIDGALVVTMQNTPNGPRAKSYIARTPEEVLQATGSKYIQAPLSEGIREILQKDGRYAVVGLPCEIEGLRKAEQFLPKLRRRVVLYIGLACGGTVNLQASQFIAQQVAKKPVPPEAIKDLQYRGQGWPGRITLKVDEKEVSSSFPRIASPLFTLQLYDIKRCSLCIDHFADLADISCLDAWVPRIIKSDDKGTSLAVMRSQRGADFWEKCVSGGIVEYSDVSIHEVVRSQRFPLYKKKVESPLLIQGKKAREDSYPVYQDYHDAAAAGTNFTGPGIQLGIYLRKLIKVFLMGISAGNPGKLPYRVLWFHYALVSLIVVAGESKIPKE